MAAWGTSTNLRKDDGGVTRTRKPCVGKEWGLREEKGPAVEKEGGLRVLFSRCQKATVKKNREEHTDKKNNP